MPELKMSYDEVQDSPIAFSVSDNDLCATCQHCAYAPGDMSLCKLQLADPDQDFPGQLDEGDEVVSCEKFIPIHFQQDNWLPLPPPLD